MAKFVVRTNCEYSLEVEAASEDEALAKADAVDCAAWMQAWAPMEIDEDESEKPDEVTPLLDYYSQTEE